MKPAFILLVVLLVTCTAHARTGALLAEVTVPREGPPTVCIYYDGVGESLHDGTIAQAAAVLEKTQQLDGLSVYILVNGRIRNESLWELLTALEKNSLARFEYLEIDRFFVPGHPSGLSEKAKKMLAIFKGTAQPKPTSSP